MFKFSTLLKDVGHFFEGTLSKGLPALEDAAKKELATVETSLIAFAKTDLGTLALDAVSAVSGLQGGVGGAAFLAAKQKFIADAATAGHDLTKLASGVVDWFIQTAYTYTAGVFSNIGATTP